MTMGLGRFLSTFLNLYATVIFVYIVMSWFVTNAQGPLRELYRGLSLVCEPYLSVFRRLMRPIMVGSAGLDFSPIVALFVLQIIANAVSRF